MKKNSPRRSKRRKRNGKYGRNHKFGCSPIDKTTKIGYNGAQVLSTLFFMNHNFKYRRIAKCLRKLRLCSSRS